MDERLSRTESLLGPEAMEKLKKAHVAVVGLGGVGSWCAEALARSGVGRLSLLDFDEVVPSNLNRQAEALASTLGQKKTDALAARLRDAAAGVELRLLDRRYTPDDREALFEQKPDYIADCIDAVTDKCDLIAESLRRGIPIVSSMGTGGKTDASLLRLGDIAKTETDPLARAVRRQLRKLGVNHLPVVWSPEASRAVPGKPGTVMWVPASAGLLMAQKIITDMIQ